MDQQSSEAKATIEKSPRIFHIPAQRKASDPDLQGNCHSVPRTWPLFDDLGHNFIIINIQTIKAVGDVGKGLTPMERWKGETMLQSPWNNVSAVEDMGEIEQAEGGKAGTAENGEPSGEQWLTPMERWQSEIVGQAPWNNVSAIGFGRQEMDTNGGHAKRDDVQEIEGDWMPIVAVGGSDCEGH